MYIHIYSGLIKMRVKCVCESQKMPPLKSDGWVLSDYLFRCLNVLSNSVRWDWWEDICVYSWGGKWMWGGCLLVRACLRVDRLSVTSLDATLETGYILTRFKFELLVYSNRCPRF